MQVRSMGRSGLRVSIAGLGCNNFGARLDLAATRAVVHKALDLGITYYDTADIYGHGPDRHAPQTGVGRSEEYLGEVLGPRRHDIVLATKFGSPMDPERRLASTSRRYIMTAVEASLKRLRTDWIDLYHIHRFDPLTPIEETLRALDDLIRQGKVRYIGTSRLPAWRLVEAQWTARTNGLTPFVSCLAEYSLLSRQVERELLPVVESYGVGFLPFFPLASGLLTGKYQRHAAAPDGARLGEKHYADLYLTESNWAKVEKLKPYAEARGRSLLELALGWLASKPFVSSVIAGATRPEQVEANVKAVDWVLSPQEMAEVDQLSASP